MKKLMAVIMILAVLGVCSSSYGYILVYKLSSTMRTVDTTADAAEIIKLKGYLIIDINETLSEVNDADVVIYGKDDDETLSCYRFDYDVDLDIDWEEHGTNVVIDFRQGGNRSGIEVILTGKTKAKNIGLDTAKTVASNLKGSMVVWDEIFLDVSWNTLEGSGSVSAPLNSGLTKAANEDSSSSNTIADEIIAGLVDKGYVDVTP